VRIALGRRRQRGNSSLTGFRLANCRSISVFAGRHLLGVEVVQGQRLPQGKQIAPAVVASQGFGDLQGALLAARLAQGRQIAVGYVQPATIARMIASPVTPVISATT